MNEGDTGGVIPLAANSSSIAMSCGSTHGIRRPLRPNIAVMGDVEILFAASLFCLYLYMRVKSQLSMQKRAMSSTIAFAGMTKSVIHA